MRYVFILMVAATWLTSCGSPSESSGSYPVNRSLTESEAIMLSEAQFKNYEAGGIVFYMDRYSGNEAIRVSGRADLVNRVGHAAVAANSVTNLAEVLWSHDVIIEKGAPIAGNDSYRTTVPVDWSWRDTSSQSGLLDAGLAIVLGLTSNSPENALILQQNPDYGWSESLFDEECACDLEIFRMGDSTVLALNPETGLLVWLEATYGADVTFIRILANGEQVIDNPDLRQIPQQEKATR